MVIKKIVATCYYPLIQLSDQRIIKEIHIDLHNNVNILTEKVPTGLIANRLLHPSEFSDIAANQVKCRTLTIEKKFNSSDNQDSREETFNAISDIEDFVSWCSFLTLKECRIIQWSDISAEPFTRNGNLVLSIGRQFNIPIDTSPIEEDGGLLESHKVESSMTINNLEKWMKIKVPNEYKSILRWYRKGKLSYFPEEKITFWITALELISKLTSEETVIENTCKNCGNVTSSRPSVNKRALFDYISDIGVSKSKTFNVIQKYRNRYAHGGKESFQYFSDEIRLVTDAANSLLVLFLCNSFNKQQIGLFQDKSISNLSNHPLLGDIGYLFESLRKLESSNLHKR